MRRVAILVVVLAGCVSSSQHKKTVAELKQCRADAEACRTRAEEAEGKLASCSTDLQAERSAHGADTAKITEMGKTQEATSAELVELQKQRAESEKRLAAFKDLTARFQKMIDTGTLRVRVRDGRVLVELPAGVLFASGKAELQPAGQKALAQVAGVLKDFDRQFLVAGHTDNVPIKDSSYKDNWELSTARAVNVTKFLVDSGMKPERLAAAGYGEFHPVGSNKTEKVRRQNRRIEIVVMPSIEELPRLPES